MKRNLSPSRLNHLRSLVESSTELSAGQKDLFFKLIEDHTPNPTSDFAEFHRWIKKGDALLTSMLGEMDALRQVTSADADLISRAAVLQILDKYRVKSADNDMDEGINWVLDKIQEGVKGLYAKDGM